MPRCATYKEDGSIEKEENKGWDLFN